MIHTHKLIKTDSYLLVVDDSVHPYDSSKVGNPLAHLPLNGSPILEGVPLLPPIEDDVEDLAYNSCQYSDIESYSCELGYIKGYNKAREKYKYTEEDIRKAIEMGRKGTICQISDTDVEINGNYTIDIIIKSLHQYPTEFECEMEEHSMDMPNIHHKIYKPKTITTAQGIQWVGKYQWYE